MTDEAEKTPEEQQERKVRKVSGGAWWKSAELAESAQPADLPELTPGKPKRKRASPRRKKDEAVAELAEAPVAVKAEVAESARAEDGPPQAPEAVLDEVGSKSKSKRKRASSSRKKKGEAIAEEPETLVAVKTEETESAGAEDGPPQTKSGGKSRARKKKKPKAKQQEADAEADASSTVSAEVEESKPEEDAWGAAFDENDLKDAEESDSAKVQEARDEPQVRRDGNGKKIVTRLLINAEEPEECRIALMENGRLESFHVTTAVRERTKNNIYKGRIVSIEANLQAAFVEIGTGRNGFLPFGDIHPEYYREDISEQSRALIRQQQWRKLKIEDVVSRGQEVLVQVVKEVTGNKGANMTTYLSLPGRCLVLMPGSDSAGISRKISGEERRNELREMMNGLSIPEGIGYIIRTASADITKVALEDDLSSLLALWDEIRKRGQAAVCPSLIYEDQDTVVRFLRDHFTPEIEEIIVDTQESYDQVAQFVATLPVRQSKVQIKLHRGAKPIFNQNNIEEQIESIYQPQVQLPSGGSIVINPTEALVAIDVNSGRTSQKGDFDKSIFLANMEAAEELARQLRLRDLGGLIVVDFIDMRNGSHIKEVEKQVKNAMKRDKAKVDISRISRFGLMQISRQKMGAPIEKGSYNCCEYCGGRGVIRSVETLALYYLRRIQTGVSRKKVNRVEAKLPLEVGQYLLNKKRADIAELEERHQASIEIILCPNMKPSENKIEFFV